MSDLVKYCLQDGAAVITIDHPPVNALSSAVARELETLIRRAAAGPDAHTVIVMGAGATFPAGADIQEFGDIAAGRLPPLNLHPLMNLIEDCAKPVVMALHGTILGGGLELAMAGHYRVIAPGAKVGLPEVKLGLIPGAGGTQRLPRLAGVEKALAMCTSGAPITAQEALACGIVDQMIEGDLLTGALAFAQENTNVPIVRTRDRTEKLSAAPGTSKAAGATLAVIEAIRAAVELPFEAGCARELELFNKCLRSRESQALIHIFFGERAVGKIPGISKDIRPLPIEQAAVVGAGSMGVGIAITYANAGIPVRIKDTTQGALDRGHAAIRATYDSAVAKGRLTSETAQQRLSLIQHQLTYEGFDSASIITEAVFENLELKQKVLAELDTVAKPDCLLATNTSSLDIDRLAAATRRPEMVIGAHFFNPANIMRLLEVVRGQATSPLAIVSVMSLAKRLGKIAVLAGNCFGFIGNRMVDKYLRQAYFLLEEGASVEQVNQALHEFGMAMGPLAMDDLSGIDISHAIRAAAPPPQNPKERQPLVPDLLFEKGWHGQKSGRGWSRYGVHRKPSPDPEVAELIQRASEELGLTRRAISQQEIIDRCIGALVDEGRAVLAEGIALRSVDIDIVYVHGYGFPAWRGGPMFYAGSKHIA